MAEQGEESRYCERFVAVADHGEVNRFLIEIDAEPCDEGVNWNHEEDSDNTVPEETPLVSTIIEAKEEEGCGSRDGGHTVVARWVCCNAWHGT